MLYYVRMIMLVMFRIGIISIMVMVSNVRLSDLVILFVMVNVIMVF